jgi:hypothetical protein
MVPLDGKRVWVEGIKGTARDKPLAGIYRHKPAMMTMQGQNLNNMLIFTFIYFAIGFWL